MVRSTIQLNQIDSSKIFNNKPRIITLGWTAGFEQLLEFEDLYRILPKYLFSPL